MLLASAGTVSLSAPSLCYAPPMLPASAKVEAMPAAFSNLEVEVTVPEGDRDGLEWKPARPDVSNETPEWSSVPLGASPDGRVTVPIALGATYTFRWGEGAATEYTPHRAPDADWLGDVPATGGIAGAQAAVALLRALEAGESRLRADVLLPGTNPNIESAIPVESTQLQVVAHTIARALANSGHRVMCLFDSAGTAASATSWRDKAQDATAAGRPAGMVSPTVSLGAIADKSVSREDVVGVDGAGDGSTLKRDYTPCVDPSDPADVYIAVEPRNSRGDAVVLALMQAVAKVPGAKWVLLNPRLDDGTLQPTFGLRATDRHAAFVATFTQAYLARGMYIVKRPTMIAREKGHVRAMYGQGWEALRKESDGSYSRFAAGPEARPPVKKLEGLTW